MSDVNITPPPEGEEAIELPSSGDAAFAELMDFLAPEEDPAPEGEGGAAAPAVEGGAGLPAPAAEGAPADGAAAGAPAAGGDGVQGVPGAGAAPGTETTWASPEATVDATSIESKWGEIATGLEARQQNELTQESVTEVKEEYARWIQATEMTPRELVGTEVPSLTREGMEVLRDSADAKDWQDAVRQKLADEVRDRAARKADDVKPMMQTLHQSIDLFKSNPDLIPGTKQYDPELAKQFVELTKPYELRVAGKLHGYTIPVQGMITQIRQQVTANRTAAAAASAAAPATPTAQQQRAAEQSRNQQGQFDAPQAGIPNKAGSSSDPAEDMSTFWGTIGLPNLTL